MRVVGHTTIEFSGPHARKSVYLYLAFFFLFQIFQYLVIFWMMREYNMSQTHMSLGT